MIIWWLSEWTRRNVTATKKTIFLETHTIKLRIMVAHLKVAIVWLGRDQMRKIKFHFRTHYSNILEIKFIEKFHSKTVINIKICYVREICGLHFIFCEKLLWIDCCFVWWSEAQRENKNKQTPFEHIYEHVNWLMNENWKYWQWMANEKKNTRKQNLVAISWNVEEHFDFSHRIRVLVFVFGVVALYPKFIQWQWIVQEFQLKHRIRPEKKR